MRSSQVHRRKDPAFWNAINRILFILLLVVGAVGIVLWFYPELMRRNEMSRELDEQKKELSAQELLRKQRDREVYLLENDKGYIETIARDKLDLMKEGETIYRLDSAKAQPKPLPSKK
ncbi:MAG: septum formation initiator family protein [Verrucomicrobiota bacterium]